MGRAPIRARARGRIAYPVATLLATPKLPANDLRELKALVNREGPDKRTSASPGPGSRLIAERGIMGTRRIPALPNVATFREQCCQGLDENSWCGL